jgi:hypothetical protein
MKNYFKEGLLTGYTLGKTYGSNRLCAGAGESRLNGKCSLVTRYDSPDIFISNLTIGSHIISWEGLLYGENVRQDVPQDFFIELTVSGKDSDLGEHGGDRLIWSTAFDISWGDWSVPTYTYNGYGRRNYSEEVTPDGYFAHTFWLNTPTYRRIYPVRYSPTGNNFEMPLTVNVSSVYYEPAIGAEPIPFDWGRVTIGLTLLHQRVVREIEDVE